MNVVNFSLSNNCFLFLHSFLFLFQYLSLISLWFSSSFPFDSWLVGTYALWCNQMWIALVEMSSRTALVYNWKETAFKTKIWKANLLELFYEEFIWRVIDWRICKNAYLKKYSTKSFDAIKNWNYHTNNMNIFAFVYLF